MSDEQSEDRKGSGVSRLSFLKASAGAAAGAAVVAVPAVAVLSSDKPGVPIEPTAATPREPVVAYIRNAERGEVTGGQPARRPTATGRSSRGSGRNTTGRVANGGDIDVLAP